MTTRPDADAALAGLFGARTATILPDALAPAEAAAARGRLAGAGYARFDLYDRGSYAVCADARAALGPALIAHLLALAEAHTGQRLALASARALRLGQGDYLLAHHDQVHEGLPLEAVLDVSPAPVPGAEVHYRRRGQVFFRAPCVPGALALVERGPTVTSNHTYVSRRGPAVEIVRVMALLRPTAP